MASSSNRPSSSAIAISGTTGVAAGAVGSGSSSGGRTVPSAPQPTTTPYQAPAASRPSGSGPAPIYTYTQQSYNAAMPSQGVAEQRMSAEASRLGINPSQPTPPSQTTAYQSQVRTLGGPASSDSRFTPAFREWLYSTSGLSPSKSTDVPSGYYDVYSKTNQPQKQNVPGQVQRTPLSNKQVDTEGMKASVFEKVTTREQAEKKITKMTAGELENRRAIAADAAQSRVEAIVLRSKGREVEKQVGEYQKMTPEQQQASYSFLTGRVDEYNKQVGEFQGKYASLLARAKVSDITLKGLGFQSDEKGGLVKPASSYTVREQPEVTLTPRVPSALGINPLSSTTGPRPEKAPEYAPMPALGKSYLGLSTEMPVPKDYGTRVKELYQQRESQLFSAPVIGGVLKFGAEAPQRVEKVFSSGITASTGSREAGQFSGSLAGTLASPLAAGSFVAGAETFVEGNIRGGLLERGEWAEYWRGQLGKAPQAGAEYAMANPAKAAGLAAGIVIAPAIYSAAGRSVGGVGSSLKQSIVKLNDPTITVSGETLYSTGGKVSGVAQASADLNYAGKRFTTTADYTFRIPESGTGRTFTSGKITTPAGQVQPFRSAGMMLQEPAEGGAFITREFGVQYTSIPKGGAVYTYGKGMPYTSFSRVVDSSVESVFKPTFDYEAINVQTPLAGPAVSATRVTFEGQITGPARVKGFLTDYLKGGSAPAGDFFMGGGTAQKTVGVQKTIPAPPTTLSQITKEAALQFETKSLTATGEITGGQVGKAAQYGVTTTRQDTSLISGSVAAAPSQLTTARQVVRERVITSPSFEVGAIQLTKQTSMQLTPPKPMVSQPTVQKTTQAQAPATITTPRMVIDTISPPAQREIVTPIQVPAQREQPIQVQPPVVVPIIPPGPPVFRVPKIPPVFIPSTDVSLGGGWGLVNMPKIGSFKRGETASFTAVALNLPKTAPGISGVKGFKTGMEIRQFGAKDGGTSAAAANMGKAFKSKKKSGGLI